MPHTPWYKRRLSWLLIVLCSLMLILFPLVAATPFSANNRKTQGGLDPRILKVMNSSPYRYGEWGLSEIDPANGTVVQSLAPAQRLFVQGSTTKIFSVSTALDNLGFDHRFVTPIYALGKTSSGSLNGSLVLLAQGDPRVAAYVSPPLSEYTKMIFKISSNIGADLMLCLTAVKNGSTNCGDGFKAMNSFLTKAHVDPSQVVLTDGHGGPNDRFTMQALTDLLRYWLGQPKFDQFHQMLPILGEPGNLSANCTNCPAKGKVFAKTGTVATVDSFNTRIFMSEALGGYMEVKPGKYYVYDLTVNNAVVPFTAVAQVFDDLANISAYLQEDVAK